MTDGLQQLAVRFRRRARLVATTTVAVALLAGSAISWTRSDGADSARLDPVSSGSATPPTAAATPPEEGARYLATVERVDKHAGWRSEPADVAGGSAGMRIGPATLHLSDGTQVQVPAGTSGGTACLEFAQTAEERRRITGFDRSTDAQVRHYGYFADRCVIVGRLRTPTEVLWFRVLTRIDASDANLGSVQSTDERTVTTVDGLTWPVAASRVLLCGGQHESVQEALESASPQSPAYATLDLRTGEVTSITCARHF